MLSEQLVILCIATEAGQNEELVNISTGDFPGSPGAKKPAANAGTVCSIPGQGAKIPRASQPKMPTRAITTINVQIKPK